MRIPFIKRSIKDPVCVGRVKLVEGRWPRPWNVSVPYYIPSSWRETHIHCIGKSGWGKSTLLKNMFVQDVQAGRGCAMIDPDEDLAFAALRDLLASGYFGKFLKVDESGVPQFAWDEAALDRVIYFEPARQSEWVIPFNILNNPAFKDDVLAGHVLEGFTRAWASIKEGPRFQSVAYPALLLLIQAQKSLPDLYMLLQDKSFRLGIITQEQNTTYVKRFLDEFNLWSETQANNNESVLNKLTFEIFNSSVNRCMRTLENRINASEIMDEGKVLIVCLRQLSDPIQRVFGNLISVLFEQAALARPEDGGRRAFYNYADEFQSFAASEGSSQSLSNVLSRGRKRNFRDFLAHQTLGQLPKSLDDALNNVGIFFTFAVGHDDSKHMIHRLKTRSEDWQSDAAMLQELRKYHYLMKQPNSHKLVQLITDLPKHKIKLPKGSLEELIKQLEQRHGIKASLIQQDKRPAKPTRLPAPKKDWV